MIAQVLGIALMVWACSSSTYGQDSGTPFPREETNRLAAEIRKNPDNDQLRRELIDLLRDRGHRLKPLSEKNNALRQKAAGLFDSGTPPDLEHAVKLYRSLANAVPWETSLYMDLGMTYEKMKNWEQAKRYYELFLYAGSDYSIVPAEISIIQEALREVEKKLPGGHQ